MGSKLVFGVTKIVSKKQADAAVVGAREFSLHYFIEAYEELRKACPGGDLRIHLSVEADSAKEVGVAYQETTHN